MSFPASHAAHFFTNLDLSDSLRTIAIPIVEVDESVRMGASNVNICSSGSTTKGSTYVPSVRLFHIYGEKNG